MENIDLTLLSKKTKDDTNKSKQSHNCTETMFELLKTQNNFFKFVKNKMSVHEASSFLISNFNYFKNKTANPLNKSYTLGTLVFCDFGSNYSGEIAYSHPAIVICDETNKIFVIPCSSSSKNVYNTDSNGVKKLKKEYILVNKNNVFNKDTFLLLNSAQWISKNRILNDFNRSKIIDPILLNEIIENSNKFIFPRLSNKIKTLENKIENLKLENQKLKDELEHLKAKKTKYFRFRLLKKFYF